METQRNRIILFAMTLMIAAMRYAAAALPDAIPLKPYLSPAPAAFTDAISFQEIPGKPGKFVVVHKNGTILFYDPKTGATKAWDKIPANTRSEEGLYTLSFHPDFEKNGRYFALFNPASNSAAPSLNYGHPGQYHETLQEFTADAAHERASGAPAKVLADFCCKDGPGHNGMFTVFGHDGMLYLSIGDGNSDGRETQSRRAWPGTVLRLDVDHPDAGRNYGIPKDNPFVNDPDPLVRKEIWAFGFRNSFKLSIDPLTGGIWVGNVGGWNEDHVSLIKKAGNFGWPITEASVCFDNSKTMFLYTAPLPNCNRSGITPPTIVLSHTLPRANRNTNCVIGPVVYRGNPASPLYGVVFYADHTASTLMAARLDAEGKVLEQKTYAKTPFQIVHLQESGDGRILAIGLTSKQFYYLDDPGLLMGRPTGIVPPTRAASSSREQSGRQLYNVAGKRLIHLPFTTRQPTVQRATP